MNREAFEAWIKADSTLPTDRTEHGYVDMTTALMWHAWQAARKQALADAALVCDVTPPYPFRPSLEAAHAIRALAT